MEIPIQVAVRIYPSAEATAAEASSDLFAEDANGNKSVAAESAGSVENGSAGTRCCVQAIPIAAGAPGQLDNGIAAGLVQAGPHTFPVTYALSVDCTQSQIYHQTVFPLIRLLMEGFDASVVTYGQRKTGKTYSLYGPGFECVYGEGDQGIVQRCVHEIFSFMANHTERTYAVNIGWVEIYGEGIRDLLGVGNVHCNNVAEVFHWLQLGMEAKSVHGLELDDATLTHSLFTFTLEQQWISKEGLIQHRLSTASFSDLCGTERVFMVKSMEQSTSQPKDLGLHALEHIVNTLTDPALMYNLNGNIPYNQTTLTTLLKDSFGGRAQTLVILCVSPLERDLNETICNLQLAFKIQCVRNYVIMNTFSDDNTPISPDMAVNDMNGNNGAGLDMGGLPQSADNFGLHFAASQWFKLVSNAEGLFSKLVASNAISNLDKEQIEEWLFLKQECEDCLSSSEAIRSQKQLGPIQEAEEPEDLLSEPETSCQQNSDNESDSESQRPDLAEKLETLMEELRLKTDTLINDKYKEFMQRQPKAVMESQESQKQKEQIQGLAERQTNDNVDERKASIGGRRRSIQPGASLSSAEIAMLNRVASREQSAAKTCESFLDSSADLQHATQLRAAITSPLESLQNKLRKLDTDIEAHQRQIKEMEQTMQLKQNIITELVKNSETHSNAKQRFHKKKSKLEAEFEKTRRQLAKAVLQGKEKTDLERLRAVGAHIEQRLKDLDSMRAIANESGEKVEKLQQSLHETKKLVKELQKKVKKEKKLKEQLNAELKALKEKGYSKALVKVDVAENEEQRGKNLKEVQARISHLDHVLREKSENLEQYVDGDGGEQQEGLRHEIRNLRRTRDHLLEQRCTLDRKLKREKMLSHREERKLLECDEAIEAIDAAIEFKNELICGHKSIDTSDRVQREKGEEMLMARLNKLSAEEMRTLLYKYFTKVIDLRDSSHKLEVQLMQLERERDIWKWKERVLSNAVRQARLEGERNAVNLQRQHEMKLTLMLRHLAEETSASSTSFSDQFSQQNYMRRPGNLALAHHQPHAYAHARASPTTTTPASPYSDSDFELDFYKHAPLPVAVAPSNKILKTSKHADTELCSVPDALERGTKNKFFAKFQVLTRYAGQAMSVSQSEEQQQLTAATAAPVAGSKKHKDKGAENVASPAIPQENLKRLSSVPPATKVTRQKNKIIIQDASRKN